MAFWDRKGGADLYVDLGTANTLVVARGRGLLINEPSVVAYRENHLGAREVLAVGSDAKEKIGRTPGNLTTCYPLKDGVIADLDVTESMLRYFMNRAGKFFRFFKPRIVISLPYGVTDIEKNAVRQAGMAAGAREVLLMDEPMAAAIGAGLPVQQPAGNMIIDIGGGTTEVAVISLCGIVHCEAVRVGGHAFDQAILSHIRRRHNLIIGEQSAERLKIQIGTALPGHYNDRAQVRGLDFVTGLPRAIEISADEISDAIEDLLKQIVEAARRTLEKTSPELMPDIVHNGAVIAGGGALIRGIDQRFQRELSIPVRIASEPLKTIAKGGEAVIGDNSLLERVLIE